MMHERYYSFGLKICFNHISEYNHGGEKELWTVINLLYVDQTKDYRAETTFKTCGYTPRVNIKRFKLKAIYFNWLKVGYRFMFFIDVFTLCVYLCTQMNDITE